jgi:glycosyltransferase involved in cell wall biosynthesis
MNPVLSIVTITRNDVSGLIRTLASTADWLADPVVEQIVIDASTPPAVVNNPVVRVIRQRSQGIAAAFNEGLQAATGEWVWFLNGGDAVHPRLSREWLLQLLNATSAGLVIGAIQYDGEAVPRGAPPLPIQWPLVGCWIPHPAVIVRRNVLQASGGFDERWRIAMDFDLWLRLLPQGVVVDVVAVPFTSFDVTGLSQRVDRRRELQRENAGVLRRHWWMFVRSSLGAGCRLVVNLFRAFCRW